jgi:microcystin-dependent protein
MAEGYVGEIRMVGFNFAPVGWLLCNGQTLAISQYQALFALLGKTFGGDGTTNFQLPDLQGRMPINVGHGTGLPVYNWGDKGGTNSATVPVPVHTHIATFTGSANAVAPTVTVSVQGSSVAGNSATANGNYLAGAPKNLASDGIYVTPAGAGTLANIAGVSGSIPALPAPAGTVAVLPAGSSPATVNVQPPYLAVYFIICYSGYFPTRP